MTVENIEQKLRCALVLHQRGQLAAAETLYRQVLRAAPERAEARHFLGLLAHQCARAEAAVDLMESSIKLQRNNALFHHNLAGVYKEQGRLARAASSYREALRLKPDYAEAHNNLGMTLMLQDRIEQALGCFEHALKIAPRFYKACVNCADALKELGRLVQALEFYRRALSLEPDNAENQLFIGLALRQLNHDQKARACFNRALELQPDYVDAHRALGAALSDTGELDAAAACYRRVLELTSTHAGAYFNLAGIDRIHPQDAEYAELKGMAKRLSSLSRDDAIKLHFALGKLKDAAGDYAEAFRHWRAGNRLKRQAVNYDETRLLNFFNALQQRFDANFLQTQTHTASSCSERAVFIVGMPRSGTSLVEQIIASHPQAAGAGELRALRQILRGHLGPSVDDAAFVEKLINLGEADKRSIGESYLNYLAELAPAARRVTDKLPGNIALAGLIHSVFPRARIIHCRREPLDTCLSCYSKFFTTGHEFTYDLTELGRVYRAYHRLAEHWRDVLPPKCLLEVNYEELVADTENHARRIIAHCGLDWDPACLRFYATKRPVKTASLAQVRQPIYTTSLERWRRYESELAPLRRIPDLK